MSERHLSFNENGTQPRNWLLVQNSLSAFSYKAVIYCAHLLKFKNQNKYFPQYFKFVLQWGVATIPLIFTQQMNNSPRVLTVNNTDNLVLWVHTNTCYASIRWICKLEIFKPVIHVIPWVEGEVISFQDDDTQDERFTFYGPKTPVIKEAQWLTVTESAVSLAVCVPPRLKSAAH